MPKQPIDLQRKIEHIFLAEKYYQATNPLFDEVQLVASSLPKISLAQVDLSYQWQQKTAQAPIYINAMTGGAAQTVTFNTKIATLASQLNIPMAVGSMSNYLKYPDNLEVRHSYEIVRAVNPQGIIWANVSVHTSWQAAQKCIDLIKADALQVHLNAAQEMVMAEGEIDFDWQKNLIELLHHISVPIIVKEVGFGMNTSTIQSLLDLGVQVVDISGRGGTNFAQIENTRNHQNDYQFMQNWGLTTIQSLLESQPLQNKINILASGGIRSPLDAVKCLVLGARAVGIAAPVLHAINHQSLKQTQEYFQTWIKQIQELMVLLNCQKLTDLKQVDYRLSLELNNFIQQKKRL